MRLNPAIFATPDWPIVQIREFMGNVDEEKDIATIANGQGWGVGTNFRVQFVSHDQDRMFAQADFVVIQNSEHLVTSNPDSRNPNTKAINQIQIKRITDWMATGLEDERGLPEMSVKWNAGVKKHQVVHGDKVLFESDDKKKAQEWLELTEKAA